MQKEFHLVGRRIARTGKRVIVITLGALLLTQTAGELLPRQWNVLSIEQAAAASSLKQVQQSIITSGAKRIDYTFTIKRGSANVQTAVHVIEVDLSNPNVALNAMSGKGNSIAQKNNIMNMVKENKAVAGINGDIFVMANDGAPLGAQVTSGMLLSSPSRQKGMYAIAITKDRKPVIDSYTFEGMVTTDTGLTFPLEGVNQSAYYPEVEGITYSHVDVMYMYTSAWGGAQRPSNSATKPTEVLVIDGIIEKISYETPLADAIPENGYILRTSGKAAKFVRDNLKIGQAITSEYALKSNTTGKAVDPSSFEMLMGGHTLLVDQGAPSAFSRDISGVSGSSYTSRSAIGYSKDGTKVYMITSERKNGNTGLSLKELQQAMVELGVYKGINLDGGGSTTMIDRPLGSFNVQLSHPTQENSMRSVANGIGVFSLAPQGKLKAMLVSGDNMMLVGQSAKFNVSGYDTYYNPVAMDQVDVVWSSEKAIGTLNGNEFTATKIGQTHIIATAGDVSVKYKVDVVGSDQIKSMKINAGSALLVPGATFNAPVSVTLKNGKSYTLNTSALEWEFVGFEGSYKDGQVTVHSIEPNTQIGYAIARYDGYGAMIPLAKSESADMLEDFEVSRYAITSQVTPADTTKGSVKLVTDLPDQKTGRALQISYDFTNSTGTKASYAVFGKSGGITLPGTPGAMTMDVYSDNSRNWMRAEIVDADGKINYVDIAKELNWSGWKNVRMNLPSGMKYPVKLKRVYVVQLDEAGSNKAAAGAVAIDNIRVLTTAEVANPQNAKIEMQVGNSTAKVNGKSLKLETAPLLQKGTTYVPVRFVSEAMGSEIVYEHKTRRVTVLRGKQMLEMNIGQKEYTLNGVRYQSEVAPFTQNGRTLIPIRLFSEQLGFKVEYEPTNKKITIE
ncbi:stalk domain-containing protein [Paenibacillus sp. IITD108]|uniref:stalk domain-containing protein n=1 Tax=Paenibacillus sp. IITD108 TaxID=3116649 RepID=UPI002F3FD816